MLHKYDQSWGFPGLSRSYYALKTYKVKKKEGDLSFSKNIKGQKDTNSLKKEKWHCLGPFLGTYS